MPKTLNLEEIKNIVSITRVGDSGGVFFDIKFTNGATLRIAPENDVVIYAKPGFEVGDGPRNFFFCDMDAGMMGPGEGPSLLQEE
jgi:hypothetical protein